jgi:hypothetical protein
MFHESMEALSDFFTTYATAAGMVWPFVTMTEFNMHANHMHMLSE